MKKFWALFLITFFFSTLTTACTNQTKQKQNMIQSKRRFAQYVEPRQTSESGRIDLSEGPKLKYDANLGPQNLNFDIKIVDPY